MGFFNIFHRTDINDGVRAFRAVNGAILLDVRTPEEYRSRRIPGSRNVPLQSISSFSAPKDTPIFVCCQSGGRSRSAVRALEKMGYTNVKNIGGIAAYREET